MKQIKTNILLFTNEKLLKQTIIYGIVLEI